MNIELERSDWEKLLQLVFLGEYAVNACRMPQEISWEHRAVAQKLYRMQCLQIGKFSDADAIEENEIADVRDRIYDSVQEYLAQFEQDVCLEKLAEMLAERDYPAANCDARQMLARERAEQVYKTKLRKEGIRLIRLEDDA